MKRYRLTKSGVCDCMLPDDNGPWVKYEDAEQAHREGWEQAKSKIAEMIKQQSNDQRFTPFEMRLQFSKKLIDAIAAMEYNEKEELKNWCDIEGVAP